MWRTISGALSKNVFIFLYEQKHRKKTNLYLCMYCVYTFETQTQPTTSLFIILMRHRKQLSASKSLAC